MFLACVTELHMLACHPSCSLWRAILRRILPPFCLRSDSTLVSIALPFPWQAGLSARGRYPLPSVFSSSTPWSALPSVWCGTASLLARSFPLTPLAPLKPNLLLVPRARALPPAMPTPAARYGRVVRPGLGVLCMHDSHSRQLLGGESGVVVSNVVPKSGAEQAGIR